MKVSKQRLDDHGERFVQRAGDNRRRKAVARLRQLSLAPPAAGTTLGMLHDPQSSTEVDAS